MRQDNLELVLRPELLELLLDVFDDQIGHALDGEVRDKTDGEFALDRGGDDSLGSWRGYLSAMRVL